MSKLKGIVKRGTTPSKNTISQIWTPDIVIISKWLMTIGAVAYCALVWRYVSTFQGMFNRSGALLGGDFLNFWSAAQLSVRGDVLILFNNDAYHSAQAALMNHPIPGYFNWLYPPIFLLYLAGLSLTSYPIGFGFWIAVTFFLYAAANVMGRPSPGCLSIFLALAPSTFENVNFGQNGFLSGALFIAGFRLLDAQPILAGILFGCLTFKPQLGLLIPIALIAAGRRRAFGAAVITCIMLVLASVLFFGSGPWLIFLSQIVGRVADILNVPDLASSSPVRMMPTLFTVLRFAGANAVVACAICALIAVGATTAVIYTFRHTREPSLRLSVIATATFIASPYVFAYDLPILTGGIIAFVACAKEHLTPQELILIMLCIVCPYTTSLMSAWSAVATPALLVALLWVQLSFVENRPLPRALPSSYQK